MNKPVDGDIDGGSNGMIDGWPPGETRAIAPPAYIDGEWDWIV